MQAGERRAMERFSLNLPGLLSMVDKSGEEKSFEVKSENICAGGAFLIVDKPPPVGTDFKMDLVLSFKPDLKSKETKTHIRVSGTVLRKYEQGIGVRFDKEYDISPVKQ